MEALNKSLSPFVKSIVTCSEPKADMTGQSGMSQVLCVWAATREVEARAKAAVDAILLYILTEGFAYIISDQQLGEVDGQALESRSWATMGTSVL